MQNQGVSDMDKADFIIESCAGGSWARFSRQGASLHVTISKTTGWCFVLNFLYGTCSRSLHTQHKRLFGYIDLYRIASFGARDVCEKVRGCLIRRSQPNRKLRRFQRTWICHTQMYMRTHTHVYTL